MRHRHVHRSIALLVAALLLAALAAPVATASATTPRRTRTARIVPLLPATDDDIPGVSLPSSPVTDSLDEATDADDVYAIDLNAGDTISLSLAGPTGTDFLVDLYRPTATSVLGDEFPIAPSEGEGYPQELQFTAGTTGTHYIDVFSFGGGGAYTLTYTITPDPIDMERYAGPDRYATAIEISKAGWAPGSSPNVIIATGADYADALAASSLAGSYDAPILLTRTNSLPDGLLAEIDRLRGAATSNVMIVGGTPAVSDTVRDAIGAHGGVSVSRFAGATRYATAVEIAKEVRRHEIDDLGHSPSTQAFVVSGKNFPDALAASPFAFKKKIPVLLVLPWQAPQVTRDAFAQLGITSVHVVGGTPAVQQQVMDSLPVATRDRLSGPDRFSTAATVAGYAVTQGWAGSGTVGLATGRKFPDALGGGPLIGKNNGVMLLSEPEWLADPTWEYVYAHRGSIAIVRAFGSHNALSDWVFGDFLLARTGP